MLRCLGIGHIDAQPIVDHRVDGQLTVDRRVDGQSIVDHRLRWRTLLAGVTTTAIVLIACLAAVQQPHLDADAAWRTVVILLPVSLATLVMACVSPAASSDDLSPVLERGMLYVS